MRFLLTGQKNTCLMYKGDVYPFNQRTTFKEVFMNNKKLIRLFTISSLALSLTAGSAFAMEPDAALDEGTGGDHRATQRSPKPSVHVDEHQATDDDAGPTIIQGPTFHHPEQSDLQTSFAPTYLPADHFQRVFGPFVEEFNALALRFYKQPDQADGVSPSPASAKKTIDEDVASQMSGVRRRLETFLLPMFGFELDTGRLYATHTWRVSQSAISQHALELRKEARLLTDTARLMRSLNRPTIADEQERLSALMTRSAASLDTLYDEIKRSSEFEPFSVWSYLRPKSDHPRNLALWVTPLNAALYEEALVVLELMARKSGEIDSDYTFDLIPYRPFPLPEGGPTTSEIKQALFPSSQ